MLEEMGLRTGRLYPGDEEMRRMYRWPKGERCDGALDPRRIVRGVNSRRRSLGASPERTGPPFTDVVSGAFPTSLSVPEPEDERSGRTPAND